MPAPREAAGGVVEAHEAAGRATLAHRRRGLGEVAQEEGGVVGAGGGFAALPGELKREAHPGRGTFGGEARDGRPAGLGAGGGGVRCALLQVEIDDRHASLCVARYNAVGASHDGPERVAYGHTPGRIQHDSPGRAAARVPCAVGGMRADAAQKRGVGARRGVAT